MSVQSVKVQEKTPRRPVPTGELAVETPQRLAGEHSHCGRRTGQDCKKVRNTTNGKFEVAFGSQQRKQLIFVTSR